MLFNSKSQLVRTGNFEKSCVLFIVTIRNACTDCFWSISAILCSYCSPRRANLRRWSSLSFLITPFCWSRGVEAKTWAFNALYCRVWILTVSLNCFRIRISFCFRLLGCCLSSIACFLRNSLSARCVYSCWLESSVWCWRRSCSSRSICTALCCRYSSSWVSSWWRSSIAWAVSNCAWRRFSSSHRSSLSRRWYDRSLARRNRRTSRSK